MSTAIRPEPLDPGTPVIATLENGQRFTGHICKSMTHPYGLTRYRVTSQYHPYRYVEVVDNQVSTRRADERYPFTPEAAARALR